MTAEPPKIQPQQEIASAACTSQAAADDVAPAAAAEPPFVSWGKWGHNELTYRGVDCALNSTVGVLTAFGTERTEFGNKWFKRPVSGFFKTILKPFLKSEKALNAGARAGSMFTSIIVGGTAIIPIMMQLEKAENKEAFIRTVDTWAYGKERVENDPRFEESYRCIGEEPHKNFTTGMLARFGVLLPMLAVTTHPEGNRLAIKYLYNPIAKASKGLCEGVGIKPRRLIERGVEEIANGDISKPPRFVSDWDFLHQTIGFDLGLTFIYSYAHEAAYKALAAFGFKKLDEKAPFPPSDTATPLASQPVLAESEEKPVYPLHIDAARRSAVPKTHFDYAQKPASTEVLSL